MNGTCWYSSVSQSSSITWPFLQNAIENWSMTPQKTSTNSFSARRLTATAWLRSNSHPIDPIPSAVAISSAAEEERPASSGRSPKYKPSNGGSLLPQASCE